MPTVVNVRNAACWHVRPGFRAKHSFMWVPPPALRSAPWPAESIWRSLPVSSINSTVTFVVAPKIRAPEDLKGKRIGVQSIGGGVWMFTMLAFEKWGLNPERDNIQFRVLGRSVGALPRRLTQGTSSTALIWATRLARRWNARATGYWPIWPQSELVVSRVLASWPSVVSSIARRKLPRKLCEQWWSPLASSTILRTRALVLKRLEQGTAPVETLRMPRPATTCCALLYDRRIYPNAEGLRNVIRLLGNSSEQLRKVKVDTYRR